MSVLDKRLNAFRPDLADANLQGKVSAARFIKGRKARVSSAVLDLKSAPSANAGLDSQLVLGDEVLIFDEADGFAWVQSVRDSYVGYVLSDGLSDDHEHHTHIVCVPRTFSYEEADMKKPVKRAFSLGTKLTITGTAATRRTNYALTASGEALIAHHLYPINELSGDYVTVAETLEHTPYLWGGASAFGIDCSGLVQLCMQMTGRNVLRDTDMQEKTIGQQLEIGDTLEKLRRGDLVFWKGHVAIVLDQETIIHANGHTMTVARESLRGTIERIAYLYAQPKSFRRP